MILMRLKFRLHVLPSFSMTIHEWMTQLHRVHHSVFLPSKVETSALCSPLNCVGQTKAINGAIVDIEAAAKKAAIAADQTFLVKPVNIPMPQALSTSRLLVVHNDAAAKAAAHLLLAVKQLKPFRTQTADGFPVTNARMNETMVVAAAGVNREDKNRIYREFVFVN